MTLSRFIKGASIAIGAAAMLSGCASISEGECLAGNWDDLGYRDGVNGTEQGRIADYSNTCHKYGAQVDKQTYFSAYEKGLTQYCVADNGYDIGRRGARYNNVCTAPHYEGFRAAYYEGRRLYDLEQTHQEMVSRLETLDAHIYDVRARIKDPQTSSDEVDRLRQKLRRLKEDRYSLKRDLRDFEQANGF